MLSTLVEDLARLPDCRVTTLVLPGSPPLTGADAIPTSDDEGASFRKCVAAADAVILIAPEIGRLLERRAEVVTRLGKPLWSCRPDAIRLTSDKLALFRHWRYRQIPTPETRLADAPPPWPDWIMKPRLGVGSLATCRGGDSWPTIARQLRNELPDEAFIVQPFHAGKPCSVAFLCGVHRRLALAPCEQILSDDDRFQYRGGRLPLAVNEAQRSVTVASRALDGIPGLLGFVGVDLLLGDADDGSNDIVIEINPRLTTSYIGLRRLCRDNLAKAWQSVVTGRDHRTLSWAQDTVTFSAGGETSLE